MANIFVIGDVMLDMDIDVTPRDNQEGAVLCLAGSAPRYYAGGAANTAKLLAYLGHNVGLYGLVSTDWRTQELFHKLSGCMNICLWPGLDETPLKIRTYQNGRISLRLDMESPPPNHITKQPSAPIKEALRTGSGQPPDAIVFVNYNKGVFNEHTREAIEEMLSWGCVTVLDPKPCDYNYIWDGVDVVTPNELESSQISIAAEHQVVTQGGKGCYILSQTISGQMLQYPNLLNTAPVTDPQVVGAGDAFTAKLSSALVDGENLVQAAGMATKFATEYVAKSRTEFWLLADAVIGADDTTSN